MNKDNKRRIPKVIITKTNLDVLELLARYYILTRQMIQQKLFPHCRSPKAVTTRLKKLKLNGYIARAGMQVVPDGQNAIPVYYLTKKGAKALAAGRQNDEFLNSMTKPPPVHLIYHWLGIVKMHMLIDEAVELDDSIKLIAFYSEWEIINKDQPDRRFQFSLHTKLRDDPPLSVQPDFGFMIEVNGYRKVFYGEYDRGTDSIRRIARKKPPGYAYLAKHNLHGKHFPGGEELPFSVLMITTTEYRRDEMAKRIGEREGGELWRFSCNKDLVASMLFRKPNWKNSSLDFGRLIKG